MDTLNNEKRYELLITTQMLFYPLMKEDFIDELVQSLPKAEEDKDNSKLSNFLAGVALIGKYINEDDLDEKCDAGLTSMSILKKYNVKGPNTESYFKDVTDLCSK